MTRNEALKAAQLPEGAVLVVLTDDAGKRIGEVGRSLNGNYAARNYETNANLYVSDWTLAVGFATA